MNDDKKAMQVSALCNGTVIDHIPADKLFATMLFCLSQSQSLSLYRILIPLNGLKR